MTTAYGNPVGYGGAGNFYRAQIDYEVSYPSDTVARVVWSIYVYVTGPLSDSSNASAGQGNLWTQNWGAQAFVFGSGGGVKTFAAGTNDFPRNYGATTDISQVFWTEGLADSVGGGARSTVTLTLSLAARPATAPSTPAAPTVTSIQQSQATVNMALPASNGSPLTDTGYWIYNAASGGSVVATDSGVNLQTSAIIGGLSPSTNYWAEVAARNAVGWSAASPRTAFTTAAPLVPDAPGSFAVNEDSGTQVTISWATPAANGATISGYQVQVSTDSGFSSMFGDYTVVASPKVVTDLAVHTNYWTRVRALSNRGVSAWSTVILFSTAAEVPGPPGAPIVISEEIVSIILQLPEAEVRGSAVTGYQLQLSTDPAFPTSAFPVLVLGTGQLGSAQLGDAVVYDETDLTTLREIEVFLGENYHARVRANSALGYSDWSDVTTFDTFGRLWFNVGGDWKPSMLWKHDDDGVWRPLKVSFHSPGGWRNTR